MSLVIGLIFSPLMVGIVRCRTCYVSIMVEERKVTTDALAEENAVGKTPAIVVQPTKADGDQTLVPTAVFASSLDSPTASIPAPMDDNCQAAKPTFGNMMTAIRREEGTDGFFRGIFPGGLLAPWFFGKAWTTPTALYDIWGRSWHVTMLILNILYVPVLVSTYRLITARETPKVSLRQRDFVEGYKAVFTPYERAHPFRAFHYSHLLPPLILGLMFQLWIFAPLEGKIGIVGPLFDHFGDEEWYKVFDHPRWGDITKLFLQQLLWIVATIIRSPLDVIITRLAIQRVNEPPSVDANDVVDNEHDLEKLSDLNASAANQFFRFSSEQRPYTGAVDCLRRIVKEEGWGALYRVWLVTWLSYWIPFFQ